MYIIVKGKRINLISTLHLTSTSELRDGKAKHYECSFVIYSETDEESGKLIENKVLYFDESELEEIGFGL